MTSFAGKVAFITGGGRGIGAEVARRLHRAGASLVLTDLDAEPLDALVAELGSERILTAVADVRDLAALQQVADDAVARFGSIDVVMANAGIASHGTIAQVDPVAFQRVIDVNVVGVFNTVRATIAPIKASRGYVLIVSSLAAFAVSPGMLAYNTSKAGVEHFTASLRVELESHGVAVGSAHMSWIDTPLVRDNKALLPTFGEMIASLPGPLSRTTSVEDCGKAFVSGIARRRRRIYCPGWVSVFRWIKPALSTRVGEGPVITATRDVLPRMDAEVAALNRAKDQT